MSDERLADIAAELREHLAAAEALVAELEAAGQALAAERADLALRAQANHDALEPARKRLEAIKGALGKMEGAQAAIAVVAPTATAGVVGKDGAR